MDSEARVEQLLREGGEQLSEGNRREAHRIWRQAAALKPDDKRIWQALLEVVESNEDRRVCLQNIVSIDPTDEQAIRRLLALGGTLPSAIESREPRIDRRTVMMALGAAAVVVVVILILILLF